MGPSQRLMLRTGRTETTWRWLSSRSFSRRWYPQGIDVGSWRGRRMIAVSWYRRDPRTRRHLAARVSLIDPRRWTSIDLALAIEAPSGGLAPARIHAGGLAWIGDRLLVAATDAGIWEFDLRDVRTLGGAEARSLVGARRSTRGMRTLAIVRSRVHDVPIRCSFVGRVIDVRGDRGDRVILGEYRRDDTGRLLECDVPAGAALRLACPPERPGIPRMQGAVRVDGVVWVAQSRGMRRGTLWRSAPSGFVPASPLPIGCEDLAVDPDTRTLWTVAEHPGRRMVRGMALPESGG